MHDKEHNPKIFMLFNVYLQTEAESKEKTWCMGPYAGVDYNLTLCALQSRLLHIHHGQPYAGVDFIPRSGTLTFCLRYNFKVHLGTHSG
jgi:hypothetical protein